MEQVSLMAWGEAACPRTRNQHLFLLQPEGMSGRGQLNPLSPVSQVLKRSRRRGSEPHRWPGDENAERPLDPTLSSPAPPTRSGAVASWSLEAAGL